MDFKGFSYGFRPGRSPHQALDALYVGIQRKRVNWVLDADIQGFFDNVSHDWALQFIEHRVADRRMLRLIQKWLKAGVSEDGQWSETDVGTPQGAVVSPLLANVYLHYVFDLWVETWRRKVARGDVIVVRYADDLVVGFQHRADAERFLEEFRERLAKFGLGLHAEKTRLIEFGGSPPKTECCVARESRRPLRFWVSPTSVGGPLTPEFSPSGGLRPRSRMVAKLKALKVELQRRKHDPTRETGAWLRTVVLGYYRYHAVPGNSAQLRVFWRRACRLWRNVLVRRSQRAQVRWGRLFPILYRWIPQPAFDPIPCSLRRHSSSVRAVCVNALARICAGGDQRWSSLPRHFPSEKVVGGQV